MGRRSVENAASKKMILILTLMQRLARGYELYAQDGELQEYLECSETRLRDALNEISSFYSGFVRVKKEKKPYTERPVTVYSLYDSPDAVAEGLERFLQAADDYDWLLELLYSSDPEIRKAFDDHLKQKILESKKDSVFMFAGRPFEQLGDKGFAKTFSILKNAVANREYRRIEYEGARTLVFPEAKCLKIIHSENNWYLAIEAEGRLQLLRIAFIKGVDYSRNKTGYREADLEKYREYFERFQNPFTHWNEEFRTATLKANARVARFFRPGMKKFMKSQEFIEETEDGSIIFSVEFTNEMEVLPFVFSWLPEIEVLAPEDLRTHVHAKLQKAAGLHARRD